MAPVTPYLRVGLNGYCHQPGVMPVPHRHNEVELLFLIQGDVDYRFNEERIRLPRRRLLLFWSGLTHQVVEVGPQALLCGLEIPLAWFLHWNLPERINQDLLVGRVLQETDASMTKSDATQIIRWASDLQSKRPGARMAALLEIEARLCRFASKNSGTGRVLNAGSGGGHLGEVEVDRIERMARYIAENCTRSLRVEEVAKVVKLHPNYAMKLFQKGFGVKFSAYLNQFRVAYAQHALITDDAKITEVGLGSGFGSLSRFNSNFRKACGMSPRSYRRAYGMQTDPTNP
jgi:AraC-like DNA-binding protein